MLKRTRSEGVFVVALLIGSTVGGVGFMVAESDNLAEFTSKFSFLSIFGLGMTGMLFGFVPYVAIAVPACLALEHRGFGMLARTVILAVGGAGLGAAISHLTIDFVISWAAMVGGCTGLALSILRRKVRAY